MLNFIEYDQIGLLIDRCIEVELQFLKNAERIEILFKQRSDPFILLKVDNGIFCKDFLLKRVLLLASCPSGSCRIVISRKDPAGTNWEFHPL